MRNTVVGVLIWFLGAFVSSPAAHAVCTDYNQYIHWLGSSPNVLGLGPYETDITISGTVAYVLSSPSDLYAYLQIVDVSDPVSPTLLGSVRLPSTPLPEVTHATGVIVVGTLAYVTAAYGGLYIINVSNPASPSILGHVDTPGVAEDVAIAGTRAYVADYSSGLQVVNISNPASPTIVGHVDTPGNAFGVTLNGSVAYVADEFAGVQVINISNPLSPTIIGTVANPGTTQGPGNAQDLVALGSTIYVADGKSGLVVIDASNPQAPVILGSVDTPGYAWEVRIKGTRAYVADDSTGLAVIDITTPSSPALLSTKGTPTTVRAVAVTSTRGFVIDPSYGLQAFDLSDTAPLFILGRVEGIAEYPAATLIGATGSLVCVPNHASLVIIDTSHPLSPHIVNGGTLLFPGPCTGVALSGTTAYVACGPFLVLDVSNPSNPQELGRLEGVGFIDLAVSENRAFVVANGHFPDDPVGGTSQRLVVIDIANPRSPNILGTLITTGRYPTVSGTLVYLVHGSDIDVVDVSSPALPTLIGGVQITGWQTNVSDFRNWMAISGNYGFVPVFQTDSNSGYLFAAGVEKVELTPFPESPRLLGITRIAGGTGGVATSGSTVFVGAGDNKNSAGRGGGIYVFDANDMSIIGGADVRAFNVVASGGLVYAMTSTGGNQGVSSLVVLPDHCDGAVIAVAPEPELRETGGLGAAFPNPGRTGSTFIPFTVARRGPVKLRIVDLSGREVRTLVNDMMDAGGRRVEWDGRNARGELVPAGIYFYELNAPGIKAARKLVRLR
jgi:hypothetical protein